jgi:carboxyl-terminal processing protease
MHLPGEVLVSKLSSFRAVAASIALISSALAQQGQPLSNFDRDRAQGILQVISSDIKKHYYDPKLHGVDWDAKVAEARLAIAKTDSFNMAMTHIAAAIESLDDSHTFFIPPQHAYKLEYGFLYQMFGNRCFVTQVRPKSDGDARGLKRGDEIVALNGYPVTRDDFWPMQYMFNILRPQAGLRLRLRDPAGNERQLDVLARTHISKKVMDLTDFGGGDIWNLVREGETNEHLMRARAEEYGDILAIKMPEFFFSASEIGSMIGKARKHQGLILDLRNNPGGSVETLKYLVGGIFDKEVKIADRVGRKETKPEVAKPMHDHFSGKLVVLVDSSSASAAELFARLVQLEKRGVVLGDVTSGSVMEAKHYNEQMGSDTVIFYGASITEWDLIMADGKSLEHTGVTPDEVLLPTAQDLATGRDPVLARAIEILGGKITPEHAGKAFPYEWPPE